MNNSISQEHKLPSIRQQVLNYLSDAPLGLTAGALIDKYCLMTGKDKKVSRNSIYPIISLLKTEGLIEAFRSDGNVLASSYRLVSNTRTNNT